MTLVPSLTPLPLPIAPQPTGQKRGRPQKTCPPQVHGVHDGADIDATTTTTELLDMILDAPSEQDASSKRSDGSDSETELEPATLINANSPPPAEVQKAKKRERLQKVRPLRQDQRFGRYERQLMDVIVVYAKALED
ncbi:hypothetical protein BGZ58_003212 [Dissophora ornata]|nr:hypothetical protein BGZ58_003212 [Dissophora ornata]